MDNLYKDSKTFRLKSSNFYKKNGEKITHKNKPPMQLPIFFVRKYCASLCLGANVAH